MIKSSATAENAYIIIYTINSENSILLPRTLAWAMMTNTRVTMVTIRYSRSILGFTNSEIDTAIARNINGNMAWLPMTKLIKRNVNTDEI